MNIQIKTVLKNILGRDFPIKEHDANNKFVSQNNNIYLVKYEEFYNDFDKIFDLIEKTCELKISNETKNEIKVKF